MTKFKQLQLDDFEEFKPLINYLIESQRKKNLRTKEVKGLKDEISCLYLWMYGR